MGKKFSTIQAGTNTTLTRLLKEDASRHTHLKYVKGGSFETVQLPELTTIMQLKRDIVDTIIVEMSLDLEDRPKKSLYEHAKDLNIQRTRLSAIVNQNLDRVSIDTLLRILEHFKGGLHFNVLASVELQVGDDHHTLS